MSDTEAEPSEVILDDTSDTGSGGGDPDAGGAVEGDGGVDPDQYLSPEDNLRRRRTDQYLTIEGVQSGTFR